MPKKQQTKPPPTQEELNKFIGRKVKLVGKHPYTGETGTIISFDLIGTLKVVRPKVELDNKDLAVSSCYVMKSDQMVYLDTPKEKTPKVKLKPEPEPELKPKSKKENMNDSILEAIDNYFSEEEDSETLQTLQPLHPLEDKCEKDEKGFYKKPPNHVMIRSFYKWRGIKSAIAMSLNCSRPTLDTWINSDKDLIEAYADSCEYGLDHAESKLNELIDGVAVLGYDFKGKPVIYKQQPNISAIKALLFSKGKKRGFVNKVETEHSGGIKLDPIEFHYHAPTEPEPISHEEDV